MVEKIKLFSWLKLWHPSKKSAAGDVVDNTSNSQHHQRHGSYGLRHILTAYGRKGWMQHWKLLHLDKRSCAQTKDVCTEGPFQNHDPKQGTIRAHLAQPIADKSENSDQKRSHASMLDPDENSLLKGSNLRINVKEGMNFSGQTLSGDVDVGGFDLQQHKFGLRNRVLPLTVQEEMGFSMAFKLKTALFSVDEEGPVSEATREMEPETFKQRSPFTSKKRSFSRILSTPVSPRSPSEAKWKMLLSCSSQAGSPRSPECQQGPEWNSPVHENGCRKGSLSTMGSPWNSQAGGNGFHQTNRASSFKGSYKQGQWVTTDSDFVVLEL